MKGAGIKTFVTRINTWYFSDSWLLFYQPGYSEKNINAGYVLRAQTMAYKSTQAKTRNLQ